MYRTSLSISLPWGLIAISVAGATPAAAQCGPHWERFPGGGMNDDVRALAVFDDDGSGPNPPELYAGGTFTYAGGIAASRIARWDGSAWTALPGPIHYSPDSSLTSVQALAVYDDDGAGPHAPALYVAGRFDSVAGVPAGYIAKWDGVSWSPVGGGTDRSIAALAVLDPDGSGPAPRSLCAGGAFSTAGGVPAARIAAWDGTSWSTLGSGMDLGVSALTVHDPDGGGPLPPSLVAGGGFTSAGGTNASRIALWDGAAWSAIGGGLDQQVSSLGTFDPDGAGPNPAALIAGGNFANAGGAPANHVAQWDGSVWSPLGSGLDGTVAVLLAVDLDESGPDPSVLYAGGFFATAGGTTVNGIARWNGLSWTGLGGEFDTGWGSPSFQALLEFDADGLGPGTPELCTGGRFALQAPAYIPCVARWNGQGWSPFSTAGGGVDGGVGAFSAYDEDGIGPAKPTLFAGGTFLRAGEVPVHSIAAWDGSAWASPGSGVEHPPGDVFVSALRVHDDDGPGPQLPALYAAGRFTIAGGATVGHIARWDGAAWSSVGGGMNWNVLALAVFDEDASGPLPSRLFAGGGFNSAGGVSARDLARWDGSSWSALAGGDVAGGVWPFYSPVVYSLSVFDDDGPGPRAPALYVGGGFQTAGGTSVNHIARWDGASWSALGPGMSYGFCCDVSETVSALEVFDDDGPGPILPALYAGGGFTHIGSLVVNGIARWDGSSWSALGSGVSRTVHGLAVFDEDGTGPGLPALYVTGSFATAGGLQVSGIARWSGSQWTALEGGLEGGGNAIYSVGGGAGGDEPPSLFVGGGFGAAGGQSSASIATWTGCGSAVAPFCAGDGSGTPCPCGNSGAPGRGCENSSSTGGALLTATGSATLAQDTLVLTCSGERPTVLSIVFGAKLSIGGANYGDGLRCISGSLKRLYVKTSAGGTITAPVGADPSVSARSAALGDTIPPGGTRYYQAVYRDSILSFCPSPPGNGFNSSNGLAVVWDS